MVSERHIASPEMHPQPVAEPIRVLAAVIRRGDRYLVCRRPAHKRHGGLWEFPGGKLLSGESLLSAAIRELGEELGLNVTSVGDSRFVRQDQGSSFQIEFIPVDFEGEPMCYEHEELRWSTVTELRQLDLAPVDRAFVEEVLSQ